MKLNTIERKRFRIRNKVKKVSKPDRLRLSISRSTKNIHYSVIRRSFVPIIHNNISTD